MRYYFFRSAERQYKTDFRQKMIRHNLDSAQALSLTVTILCLSVTTVTFLLNYFQIFSGIIFSPVHPGVIYFSFATYLCIVGIRKSRFKNSFPLLATISNLYVIIIMTRCVWITFEAQHNPANTMTMFLLGTFTAGILWLFTARETIAISLLLLGLFICGLPYFQVDHTKIWSNMVVAMCVVSIFFTMSRIIYSYHYNYYIQLKTVERKNTEISRMDRNKTEMLGIVAHDLRSPINSIAALIDLSKNYATSPVEREQYYELILQACRETDDTIKDLMDVAKGGEEALETSETEMGSFLNDIQQQWMLRTAGNRKLQLINSNQKLFAHIHAQKMQRVLDNLINNAVKFTRDNGIISIRLDKQNDRMLLSISDNGIGIPEDLHPYLFDRFSRAGRNGLNGEKSHGLGLSICKQIIEQHNGMIYVNSKVNNGTTFNIDLPLHLSETTPS